MFLTEWSEFPSGPCLAEKKNLDDSSRLDVVEIARIPDMFATLQGKKLDDSSRLDVVEIARVPDMLPSLFPSWPG